MSIIDNKGKLFGKVNIIDFIAVVLIIAVVALLGTKLLTNDSVGLAGPGQPVVSTVKVENVDEDVYEFIQDNLPSQLMANGQLQNGYVTAVGEGECGIIASAVNGRSDECRITVK